MDKIGLARPSPRDAEVAMALLPNLLIEQASASPPRVRDSSMTPSKVYAVMALTSMLTFGTLVTGYQLLFSHQLFA